MTAPAREIGRVRGARTGPTLIVVAAIHGNEPAGVHASRRVLDRIAADGIELTGDLVCLLGNAAAFAAGTRVLTRDLNRAWTDDRVAALDAGTFVPRDADDAELAALHAGIASARDAARGAVFLLDLHTTSGDGPPFSIAAGTGACRTFAGSVPLTCLTGLLELLDGTMLVAMARHGLTGAVVEAGRHADRVSVDRAEAAMWIALVASGLIEERSVPFVEDARRLLATARGDLPAGVHVDYRHAIRPEDGFRMRPGFRHFQRVAAGEVLATDVRGDVRAPHAGYILMPLYQGTGSDGFFLGR